MQSYDKKSSELKQELSCKHGFGSASHGIGISQRLPVKFDVQLQLKSEKSDKLIQSPEFWPEKA